MACSFFFQCDFDGPSTLSDFARDLYHVGEVSLSQVRSITGSGAPVALVTGHDPDDDLGFHPSAPVEAEVPSKPDLAWHKNASNKADELDDFLCSEMDNFLEGGS